MAAVQTELNRLTKSSGENTPDRPDGHRKNELNVQSVFRLTEGLLGVR